MCFFFDTPPYKYQGYLCALLGFIWLLVRLVFLPFTNMFLKNQDEHFTKKMSQQGQSKYFDDGHEYDDYVSYCLGGASLEIDGRGKSCN
jgi:hypothetical protein